MAEVIPGDAILTILVYAAGAILIVSIPLVIIIYLIKNPLAFIFKSWADAKYRAVDTAMRATERIKLDDGTIIVKRFINGAIDYETIHTPHAVASAEQQQATASNTDAINAARWIVVSYATQKCDNAKHKHGPTGNQLLTQDECLASGVIKSPRDWTAARDWLVSQWLVTVREGIGNAGTFTDRPLSEMLDVLTTLPQRKR